MMMTNLRRIDLIWESSSGVKDDGVDVDQYVDDIDSWNLYFL